MKDFICIVNSNFMGIMVVTLEIYKNQILDTGIIFESFVMYVDFYLLFNNRFSLSYKLYCLSNIIITFLPVYIALECLSFGLAAMKGTAYLILKYVLESMIV